LLIKVCKNSKKRKYKITNMKKRIVVIGGGTFEPIRNHLSLCAPAFGTTARKIHSLLNKATWNDSDKIVELALTKMADPQNSHSINVKLITNEDVENFVDKLIADKNVSVIVLNVAFCDFKSLPIEGVENGFHADRLKTAEGNVKIELTPTLKIISKIRKERSDIFLVGFKTTTNKTQEEQFLTALKFMKSTKCNLVFANDTVTRNNMIITPEETYYGNTVNRDTVLKELCEIIYSRSSATYNKSNFVEESENYNITSCPENFQTVVKFLIDNGGYIENNGNGFTPGHFCAKINNNSFYSSQRKANHNLVFQEGLSLVTVGPDNETFTVKGKRKASVGARSQWLLLQKNPDFDCIIHTHNPLKESSLIPTTPQKPFQCGSLECGINTLNHLGNFGDIKAVYLEKHGANIMFKSSSSPKDVISFIKDNVVLGTKVK
jgi:hypothetical protein